MVEIACNLAYSVVPAKPLWLPPLTTTHQPTNHRPRCPSASGAASQYLWPNSDYTYSPRHPLTPPKAVAIRLPGHAVLYIHERLV